MRLTRQAALAIALVCGLLAAILAWVWISRQAKPTQVVPQKVLIPVPLKIIPAQTDLRPDMFRSVSLDRLKVPAGVVLSEQEFQGRVSLSELTEGQPVKTNQVAVRSSALGLAYGVTPGLRGVTVALDGVGTVGDFVKPGNHVDILASFQKEGQVVVRTVVQDVVVLAVGASTSVELTKEEEAKPGAKPEEKAATPARRQETPVTLALTPYQAQLILTSDIAGKLRLVLRAMGDRVATPLPSSNSWSLVGSIPKAPSAPSTTAAAPQPTPPAQPAAPTQPGVVQGPQAFGAPPTQPPPVPGQPRRPSVEVIRGGQREIITPD